MSGLSTSQYATVLSKGTGLVFSLGLGGITTAVNTLGTVITNNLSPVYAQLVAYGQKCEFCYVGSFDVKFYLRNRLER